MTTTAKATPVKAMTPSATATIAKGYESLVNHDGEIEFVLKVAEMLRKGTASIRPVQAVIGSCVGQAPTIRKSHVQYFVIFADLVKIHPEAKERPVSEILKLAERVARNYGQDGAEEILKDAEDLEDLKELAPSQTKAKAAKEEEEKVAPLTVESVISSSNEALRRVLNGKNLRDVSTEDLQTLKALIGTLVTIAKTTEAKAKAATN